MKNRGIMKNMFLTMAAVAVALPASAQTADDTVYVFKDNQPFFLQASTPVGAVRRDDDRTPVVNETYTLNGLPATDTSRGVIISGGRKTVR